MYADINYTIDKNIAVLGTYGNGWSKELNLVAWNGNEPKYDIRDWNTDHTRMSKGITLTPKEFELIGMAFIAMTTPEEQPVEVVEEVAEDTVEETVEEPKVYSKSIYKIVDRMMKLNIKKNRPELAKAFEHDGGYYVTDTFRIYKLERPLAEVSDDAELTKTVCVDLVNGNTNCEYIEYGVDIEALKKFIKDKGYRATSTKVEPFILETDGVKVGVNPIYLRETIEVMGTNKVYLPTKSVRAIKVINGKDEAYLCPIRLNS
jgi:hypothetical protein